MEDMERALQITGVGIGLVFASLTLLAFTTAALSRLLAGRGEPPAAAPQMEPASPVAPSADLGMIAAIAAALTRAMAPGPPRGGAAPRRENAPAGGSLWQAHGRRMLMASQAGPRKGWRDRPLAPFGRGTDPQTRR